MSRYDEEQERREELEKQVIPGVLEIYEGKLRPVVNSSRWGWWRFHEHYDRHGYCRSSPETEVAWELVIRRARKVAQELSLLKAAYDPDPKALALSQGAKLREHDLRAAGGTYDLAQVRDLLGISRQAVDKRVRSGSLLAVPGPKNRRRYPVIQFAPDGRVLDGLHQLSAALPSRNPWVLLNFLVNPDPRLENCRPIDLLKRGCVDEVIESARRVDEQGA